MCPQGKEWPSQVYTPSLIQRGRAHPLPLPVSTPGEGGQKNEICSIFSVPYILFLLFRFLLIRRVNENEHLERLCYLAFSMFYDILIVKLKMSLFFIHLNTVFGLLGVVLHSWGEPRGGAGRVQPCGGSAGLLDARECGQISKDVSPASLLLMWPWVSLSKFPDPCFLVSGWDSCHTLGELPGELVIRYRKHLVPL